MNKNNDRYQKKDHLKIYKAVLSTLFKEKSNSLEINLLIEKINSKTNKSLQTGLFKNQIIEILNPFEQSHLIKYTEDHGKVIVHLTTIGKDISSLIKDTRRKQKRRLTHQYQLILTRILKEGILIHENDIDQKNTVYSIY